MSDATRKTGGKSDQEKLAELKIKFKKKTSAIAKLKAEITELKKTVSEEIPQGAGRELLADTLKEKGEEFDKAGNLLDAFHLYRRALRLYPDDIETLYKLAVIYFSADMKVKTIECLRAILEIDPSHQRAAESLEQIESEE